ncbi:unnamed protein product [Lactuca virosa]|uniref:Uncharacterized protein n=1 Tax=Lactuca virosa TaxID=75947 RepID=A0AAU9P868_9ASTR|nr:unnamed protein product [Lactuca virosa]
MQNLMINPKFTTPISPIPLVFSNFKSNCSDHMENWRKKGNKYNQEPPRLNSHNYYGNPPLGGNSNWQQSVPSWEKRFVTSIGAMSWKKFLEAKAYAHLYENIMKWNDSAGEEAFQTAKHNFHAQIHGLPCDIKPHNPDLYIDQIDWNEKTNHDLVLDLNSDSVAPNSDSDSNREPVVIFGDALPDPYKNYSPAGWGDESKTRDCQNKMPEDCNNGIIYDDYVNNWDVDLEAINPQLFSSENDNKAHGDQGWNNDNNGYQGWNNNIHYRNVNNGGGRHRSWRFNGNNDRSWGNNGNRRKPVVQAHGNQWVHRVHP